MNKAKEIEKMARIICRTSSNRGQCQKCRFYKYKSCDKFEQATNLYNADYRQLSELMGVADKLPDKDGKERITLKELEEYRKVRANRERVEAFIEQCEYPYIKQLMIYRYVLKLSWAAVAIRVGWGSDESSRAAVRRYVLKGGAE